MGEIVTGQIKACFGNHNPLEEENCQNFSGHITLDTGQGNIDIQTDNPELYLSIETKACGGDTPITIPVEKHEDHFHLLGS